jgi:sulfur transfer complex TusBCD TusB component (DsrH family)
MTLHIISNLSTLPDCLSMADQGDALLFRNIPYTQISDADHKALQQTEASVYWLINKNGEVGSTMGALPTVDYNGFVQLCTEHPNSISWS